MKIYLVRHGQCESNVIGRYNLIDEDINETGIIQAEDLREKIIEHVKICPFRLVQCEYCDEAMTFQNLEYHNKIFFR